MALLKSVYEATRTFPPEELYGLTAQIFELVEEVSRLLSGLHRNITE